MVFDRLPRVACLGLLLVVVGTACPDDSVNVVNTTGNGGSGMNEGGNSGGVNPDGTPLPQGMASICDGDTRIDYRDGVVTTTPCPYACLDGACTGVCKPNQTRCSGNTIERCSSRGAWAVQMSCTNGCSNGRCNGAECAPGDKRCNGNVPQACGGSGQWESGASCQFACVNGACSDGCVPGSRRCSGASIQVCNTTGSWSVMADCPNGCNDGMCVGGGCTEGAMRCAGATVQRCAVGVWVASKECPSACFEGACVGVCKPGTRSCNEKSVIECNAEGMWQAVNTCDYICNGGSCTGVCEPGAARCTGNLREVCNSEGLWTRSDCPGGCANGRCNPTTPSGALTGLVIYNDYNRPPDGMPLTLSPAFNPGIFEYTLGGPISWDTWPFPTVTSPDVTVEVTDRSPWAVGNYRTIAPGGTYHTRTHCNEADVKFRVTHGVTQTIYTVHVPIGCLER